MGCDDIFGEKLDVHAFIDSHPLLRERIERMMRFESSLIPEGSRYMFLNAICSPNAVNGVDRVMSVLDIIKMLRDDLVYMNLSEEAMYEASHTIGIALPLMERRLRQLKLCLSDGEK